MEFQNTSPLVRSSHSSISSEKSAFDMEAYQKIIEEALRSDADDIDAFLATTSEKPSSSRRFLPSFKSGFKSPVISMKARKSTKRIQK